MSPSPRQNHHGRCRYCPKGQRLFRQEGTGGKGGGKKSSALEPFDPSSHAEKEKADAVSMWIVIFFGLSVALLMRFYMMPGMNGTKQILWLLPLLMISLIRPIHRLSSRQDSLNYTQLGIGLGLRSCIFSHGSPVIRTGQPPLADIAAPHLAGAIDIATTEGISDSDLDGSVYEIRISQDSIPVLLGLAVRDNVDAENSTMNLTIQKVGQMELISQRFRFSIRDCIRWI